ncbi:MAG: Mut7-C RNAse domain-containing protein [Dehalococcoidia bacterium]|nr:Mut7-C RNAse domain-containing protein [Dehalococcoidia bacterium]
MSDAPRFLVDINVGRLARRLRVLGYDALLARDVDDNALVRLALREGRVLLTRDTHILKRRVVTLGLLRALLIQHDVVADQLRQVVDALSLEGTAHAFSRCIECNEPLAQRRPDEVRDMVPPYVYGTQRTYSQCPTCRRVYWRGTHWENMRKEMERVRPGLGDSPA